MSDLIDRAALLAEAKRREMTLIGPSDTYALIDAAPAAPSPALTREALNWEQLRMDRKWPTPNHMRSAADALDVFTPAKYGDILRWVADASDISKGTPPPAPTSTREET